MKSFVIGICFIVLYTAPVYAQSDPEEGLGSYAPNAEDYKDRGIAFDAKGEYEKAIESFQKSLEMNPNDGSVWLEMAQTYKKMGMYEEAVDCYEKVIEYYDAILIADPVDAKTWKLKGDALKKLGKYGRARECYTRATEIDSDIEVDE